MPRYGRMENDDDQPLTGKSISKQKNASRWSGIHELTRPKSILQRLASPDSRASLGFSPRATSQCSALHNFRDSEIIVDVDLSSFEGPATAKLFTSQASKRVVSAQVRLGPTADTLSPRPNVNLKLSRDNRASRSDTIRRYGQQLATETNMIVSVQEIPPVVDLSSLEGPKSDVQHAWLRKQEMLSWTTRSSSSSSSYFYPADPEQPNWKPFSMRPFYILMLFVLSLALAGVQEFLCQRSQHLKKQGRGLIQYNMVSDMSTSAFFCWKYLPTIVMVSYGVLWQVTDYEVKRLEPYYQLAQPTGNIAAKSLNLDYVTLWSYFVPVKAARLRHWAVFFSSLGAILATTAAPSLLNPSIASVRNPNCSDVKRDCAEFKYFVHIHPVWSRLVTACLVIVAILAAVLSIQLRRKSGLLGDPRGIAGVAAMATKSHILTDFQGMDEALHDEIHKRLRHRRYILYKSTIWQGEYVRASSDDDDNDDDDDLSSRRRATNPHPIILHPHFLVVFLAFLCICLPLIPIATYTRVNTVAVHLPWLLTLIATLIKQLWTTLEFAVKMIEPFYTLSKGNAPPSLTLTLDYQGTPYGLLPFQALLHSHYLVALVGLGSILGDILTVVASSLSLSAERETQQSFTVSSTLAIAITVFLILTGTLVFTRRRRPFMPRQPSTIASILAFIYQSRMLEDFEGTERFTNAQMEAMLVAKNKRYGLGWVKGRDQRPHCAVDEEPMLSRYVHGVSYIKARAPWEDV